MKVIGLAGWSGAGKTTLLSRLIPHFNAQGLRVSVIKHAHHQFDVDVPGKDSWRHREAGAAEVLVASSNRWALMHELRGAAEPRLPELLSKLSAVDLVVVCEIPGHGLTADRDYDRRQRCGRDRRRLIRPEDLAQALGIFFPRGHLVSPTPTL